MKTLLSSSYALFAELPVKNGVMFKLASIALSRIGNAGKSPIMRYSIASTRVRLPIPVI